MSENQAAGMDAKQPGMSFNIRNGKIQIHKTTLQVLGYPEFYRFLFNPAKKMLAIQACGIDDEGAHRMPKIVKSESCEVSSKDFLKLIYRSCGWTPFTSYRIEGLGYHEKKTAAFDLTGAVIINDKSS